MLISIVWNFVTGTLGGFVGATGGLNFHMWRDPGFMTHDQSDTAAAFMCAYFALFSGVGATLICTAMGWAAWQAFPLGGVLGLGRYMITAQKH